MSSMKMKCKIMDFNEVYDLVKKLSEQIKSSGYKPDTIIGLARGGWVPARLLCDFLGITDLISLKVEHWIQTGKTKDEASIKYPLSADLSEKKVLVVDDITDTGKSLISSVRYLKDFHPKDVRVACMQYIPASKYKPDYFADTIKVWTWFIYPWNWIEDSSTLVVRLLSAQKDLKRSLGGIEKGLKENFEIKWKKNMLKHILSVMEERGQIQSFKEADGVKYKVKEEKVIQL